ncbi:MAG TPA: hypothetical protein PLO65_10100 [Caulobacter sp.]|nr:hypothetical protein [Caulobacter sp.]
MLLFFISSHHLTLVRSLVATRNRSGRWDVQAIDEERPGLVGSGLTATRLPPWSLSIEDSRRLDRLLAGRSLYAEPVRQGSGPDQLGVGATFVSIEITTPSARRTSMLAGKWAGRTGDIVRLLSPKD